MNCKYCEHKCIKKGRQKNGVQRYRCKGCGKYQQSNYRYQACCSLINTEISNHIKEGCGIRSIGRLLNISPTMVITRTLQIASTIEKPSVHERGAHYQVDELYTFISEKESEVYIIYALNSTTKTVFDFHVGKRTKKNLGKVVDSLLKAAPKKISTDGLNSYPNLIPKSKHSLRKGRTNHIERHNLTLRTHVKRLNRKTICYSRSIMMLIACLKIYFWG